MSCGQERIESFFADAAFAQQQLRDCQSFFADAAGGAWLASFREAQRAEAEPALVATVLERGLALAADVPLLHYFVACVAFFHNNLDAFAAAQRGVQDEPGLCCTLLSDFLEYLRLLLVGRAADAASWLKENVAPFCANKLLLQQLGAGAAPEFASAAGPASDADGDAERFAQFLKNHLKANPNTASAAALEELLSC